jgi:hypothetical protein
MLEAMRRNIVVILNIIPLIPEIVIIRCSFLVAKVAAA